MNQVEILADGNYTNIVRSFLKRGVKLFVFIKKNTHNIGDLFAYQTSVNSLVVFTLGHKQSKGHQGMVNDLIHIRTFVELLVRFSNANMLHLMSIPYFFL